MTVDSVLAATRNKMKMVIRLDRHLLVYSRQANTLLYFDGFSQIGRMDIWSYPKTDGKAFVKGYEQNFQSQKDNQKHQKIFFSYQVRILQQEH